VRQPWPNTLTMNMHAKTRGSRVRDTNRPRNPKTALNEDQAELLTDVKAIFDEVEATWRSPAGNRADRCIPGRSMPLDRTTPASFSRHAPCRMNSYPIYHAGFRRDFADRGGKFKVTPVWPITILRDFQRQHENWGGIVVYLGDRLPGQAKNRLESTYEKIFSALKKITDREVEGNPSARD
jgi:hypothetical protein